jgi:hypothetical protein
MIKRLFQQPWFWPQDVREDPGFINRMGRVFHWTCIVTSIPLSVIGAFSSAIWIWRDFSGAGHYDGDVDALAPALLVGVLAWMIGRGVRYVFSGE